MFVLLIKEHFDVRTIEIFRGEETFLKGSEGPEHFIDIEKLIHSHT